MMLQSNNNPCRYIDGLVQDCSNSSALAMMKYIAERDVCLPFVYHKYGHNISQAYVLMDLHTRMTNRSYLKGHFNGKTIT